MYLAQTKYAHVSFISAQDKLDSFFFHFHYLVNQFVKTFLSCIFVMKEKLTHAINVIILQSFDVLDFMNKLYESSDEGYWKGYLRNQWCHGDSSFVFLSFYEWKKQAITVLDATRHKKESFYSHFLLMCQIIALLLLFFWVVIIYATDLIGKRK